MNRIIKQGSTNVSILVRLFDATTGAPYTGATIADLRMAIYTLDTNTVTQVQDETQALTALATIATAHTDNYAIEVDAVSSGLYRIDLPDAAVDAAAVSSRIIITETNGYILECVYEIELAAVPTDVTHINGGLTNGNNATLSLAKLDINNSSGNGMEIQSSGGNGKGLYITSAGSGIALDISQTGTADAVKAEAIGAAAYGVQIVGGSTGVIISGAANGNGLELSGSGTGDGFTATSGGTGQGISTAVVTEIQAGISSKTITVGGADISIT